MKEHFKGIKALEIRAATRYSIMSAYEFEFLKIEEVVKKLIKECTIYFIIQRPLTYMNNVCIGDGQIHFEIFDDKNAPLHCSFSPIDNGFKTNEEFSIDIQFFSKEHRATEPYDGVAGFKIFNSDGAFLGWVNPQKFLYQILSGSLNAECHGDIYSYLDYKIHYIGKAFSQFVWERLTGHHAMQSILTLEDAFNSATTKNSFEISLLMLDIDGFDEANMTEPYEFFLGKSTKPIVHNLDSEESIQKFFSPKLSQRSEELTNEVEAMLINRFRPEYNDIKYDNYPNIKNGARKAGYSFSTLFARNVPARLYTDYHSQNFLIPFDAHNPDSLHFAIDPREYL